MKQNNTFELIHPFGPPIGKFPLELELVSKINQIIDDPQKLEQLDDWGHKLAGEVSSEIRLPHDLCEAIGLTEYLKRCTTAYIFQITKKTISKFELIQCWIVRQHKNEFNPTHWHSGHISGAGWLKVPPEMASTGIKTTDYNGHISFNHGSKQFLSEGACVIEPKEGLLTIFPHYLMHHVYPFSCEGERRSIAFNAHIDENIFNVYG